MEKKRFPDNESVNSETIQETLQELCGASFVSNYCSYCTSGGGCCTMSHDAPIIDEQSLFDAVNRLPNMDEFLPQEVRLTTETVHTSTSEYASFCSSQSSMYLMEETSVDCPSEEGDEAEDASKSTDDYHRQSEVDPTLPFPEEETHVGHHEQNPRKRTVMIDLSQEDDLSDAEIIQRILSSTEGMTSDEPLEVILEIVGEEGNDRFWNNQPKTFQTLREKLRNSTFFTSSPKILLANHPEIKALPHQFERNNDLQKEVAQPPNKNQPSIYEQSLRRDVLEPQVIYSTPSYQKANTLINEIENCFTETANIVEKSLGSVRIPPRSPFTNEDGMARHVPLKENPIPVGEENQRVSKTVEEAINIFDSLLNHQKTHRHKSGGNIYDNEVDSKRPQRPVRSLNESEEFDQRNSNSTEAINGVKSYETSEYQEIAYGDDYYQSCEYGKNNLDDEPNNYSLSGSTIPFDYFPNNHSGNSYSTTYLDDDSDHCSSEGLTCDYLNNDFGNDSESELKYHSNNFPSTHSYEDQSERSTMNYFQTSNDTYHYDWDKPQRKITESDVSKWKDVEDSRKERFLDPDKDSVLFWRNWQSGFEKDVDELFRECYEANSTEPSTTLGSCLKNLENLTGQLKVAKDIILKEIICNEKDFNNCVSMDYCSRHITIEKQKKLAIINELIEKKLRNKLKLDKFHVGPTMIGLEGRTHKMIAKVTPNQTFSENGHPPKKENDNIISFLMDNENINIKRTFHNNIIENVLSKDNIDLLDSAFESNSEISMTTNTNSFASLCPTESISFGKLDGTLSKNSSSCSTDEGVQSILSHEETLALYEDNQELQQSLLSILHSLNDIHDNFLKRRQEEVDMSRKSSRALHDDIKANMTEKIMQLNSQHPGSPISCRYLPKDVPRSDAMADDFEAINKIIRVSDELKNLWLNQEDLKGHRRHKPSRSLSLNRFNKPKRYTSGSTYYSNCNSEEDFSETEDDLIHQSEKCYSMPNLNQCSLEDDPFRDPLHILQPNSFFVENFTQQMKYENAKCYEVTLNFLKRIMEACKLLDGEETPMNSFYDFTTSQEHSYHDHTQHPQNKANLRTY